MSPPMVRGQGLAVPGRSEAAEPRGPRRTSARHPRIHPSGPHPLQLTDDEDALRAVQARRANVLLGSAPFSAPIVSVTGRMARMTTISPSAFVDFKRWMASTADRDPLKVSRDRLQASIVEELANRFQPGG
ncbi:GSU2403 family nucleotidyltransferase fold protein [Cupriavidus oxalaticus]|uniref:GSU2403 family nucleotidyltransferase fold protein n=2 Tax=Cupriavidus oxalaticus TaxID=96344 RepID=UPI002795A9D2|nr:GSU2403 family nucleotidyltransferase fold protein [Cupriavidus oxalaticus]WQD84549.1 GSU2403 family nucleotidyltransferase fold protein [Cupriavidus oxalaticus]